MILSLSCYTEFPELEICMVVAWGKVEVDNKIKRRASHHPVRLGWSHEEKAAVLTLMVCPRTCCCRVVYYSIPHFCGIHHSQRTDAIAHSS